MAPSPILQAKNILWILLGPILGVFVYILSLYSTMTPEAKAMAAILVWMAVWWLSEALPISVTSLLPLALFPVLGVMDSSAVSMAYVNDTVILFIGSFLIALCVEKYKVHTRIALKLLLLLGKRSDNGAMDPCLLLLGFCLGPGLLSMWISNTATAVMMMPLAVGILRKFNIADIEENVSFGKAHQSKSKDDSEASEVELSSEGIIHERKAESVLGNDDQLLLSGSRGQKFRSQEAENALKVYCKGIALAIAYSASIGGMATLIGTGPNLVLSGMWNQLFPDAPPITFMSWFLFGAPLSLTFLGVLWLLLCVWFCPKKHRAAISSNLSLNVVRSEYEELGPISFAEVAVLVDFGVVALMWMTRNIGGESSSWSALFHGKVGDGTIAIFFGLLLFVIPNKLRKGEMMLSWDMVPALPWSIVLLLGGGFALSSGVTETELSNWLASQLQIFESLPSILLVPAVSSMIVFFTEFSSNAATATVFLPILAQVAVSISRNPLLLLVPATCACSFAFMLPVATPPNAVAYATKLFSMTDMLRVGMVLNVIGVVLLTVWTLLFGAWIWGLNDSVENIPWYPHSNAIAAAPSY